MPIGARKRIDIFLDSLDIIELEPELEAIDRLKFKDVKNIKTGF